MNELKKLATEYFALQDKCDGTASTFAALYPQANDLKKRVENFRNRAKSREVRYFALKLYDDVSNMETRFWRYTW